jgi:CMP-N,N'-diacetyllegionaminic acid synthase
MYKNKKVVAFIPARGGSKGIPNKNIISIEGKPLIEYTIETAKKSEYIDDVYITSDSNLIHDFAIEKGCLSNGLRPSYLATDSTKTIDVIVYEVGLLRKKYDYIILLQPTQPLRQIFHIDESIKMIIENNYKSLVSVTEVDQNPILIRSIENNSLISLIDQNSSIRRQDFKKYFFVNGMIYINRIIDVHLNLSFNDNLVPYIIDKKYFVDIDEPNDIEIFATKLRMIKNDVR